MATKDQSKIFAFGTNTGVVQLPDAIATEIEAFATKYVGYVSDAVEGVLDAYNDYGREDTTYLPPLGVIAYENGYQYGRVLRAESKQTFKAIFNSGHNTTANTGRAS